MNIFFPFRKWSHVKELNKFLLTVENHSKPGSMFVLNSCRVSSQLSRRIKLTFRVFYTCCYEHHFNRFFWYLSFQLSLVQLATYTSIKENRLHNLRKSCPEIQKDFWICMNQTIESIDRGSHWIGRSCCSQALLPLCQQGSLAWNVIKIFKILMKNKFTVILLWSRFLI